MLAWYAQPRTLSLELDESCPYSGKPWIFTLRCCTLKPVPGDLVAHVAASTGLSATAAARLVRDIVDYFAEPTEVFVRRRHRDLQARGLKNPAIFAAILDELSTRVVAPPELTERQLRRIVYG
jgi:protein-L-isoaspartate O-methyltransferase